MEIKILNSILHKELSPWIIDTGNKAIAEKLKKVGTKEPNSFDDLLQQIKILVADYPDLSKWLDKQKYKSTSPTTSLYFSTELPGFTDVITKYYSLLINKEVLRIFNAFLLKSNSWNSKVEIIYHTNILLRNIMALTRQVFKEMEERGFEEEQEEYSLSHFVLQYLKHSLITLYFSVQEVHKEVLEQTITVEDFYLLELNKPLASVQEIILTGNSIIKDSTIKVNKKFSFGFNGDKDRLKLVITQLNNTIELIDENSSETDLFNALTAKALTKKSVKIRLGCETVQFSYIVNKLAQYFSNLTPTTIEESGLFYSKKNTLIKAQNLYKNKISSPKNQDTIDKIIKHLQ